MEAVLLFCILLALAVPVGALCIAAVGLYRAIRFGR